MTSTLSKATRVPLGRVEEALSGQLKDLQGDSQAHVQRARMSNLIVYCDNQAVAAEVAPHIPEIVETHPARVLFLVGEPGSGADEMKASVSVEAHPLGRHQQACTEMVVLEAGGEAASRFHFAVRSLLIGDLPTNLWWAAKSPPALSGEFILGLAEQAQQIIYDSNGWVEPAKGVIATAAWIDRVQETRLPSRWRVVSDLNWRRLKIWRRLLGQSLDPVSAPGASESITELQIDHGPHAVVQACLLVSWLAIRLGWRVEEGEIEPGVDVEWLFHTANGKVKAQVNRLAEGTSEIQRLRIHCQINGHPVVMHFGLQADHRLAITLEGINAEPRTVTVPRLTAADIIARQLSDREKNPLFCQSMEMIQVLALRLFD